MREWNGDRPPSFQFYPRDLLTSTAVATMSPAGRGGYLMLLCHAWIQDEPGVLPDDDASLAALSGLGCEWASHRAEVSKAFEVLDGRWVQRRMVQEREAQRRRYLQAKKGASVTNDMRWRSVAQRPDSESLSCRTAVAPSSASSFALEEESKEEEAGVSRLNAAFRPGLLEELQKQYPNRDVPLIASKLLEERGRYKNWNKALRSWCAGAERRDTERNGSGDHAFPVDPADYPLPSQSRRGQRPPGYVCSPMSDEWVTPEQRKEREIYAKSQGFIQFKDP